MVHHFTGKFIKRDGLLRPYSLAVSKQEEIFVSHIPEGSIVECFFEMQHDDGTLPQLAKLHVMIKELATHIGETAENMKLLVKDRAGLCIAREVSGKEYFLAKSFGECSKEELSLAIQAALEIGEEVNYLLH
jgi:hypothetical protein